MLACSLAQLKNIIYWTFLTVQVVEELESLTFLTIQAVEKVLFLLSHTVGHAQPCAMVVKGSWALKCNNHLREYRILFQFRNRIDFDLYRTTSSIQAKAFQFV